MYDLIINNKHFVIHRSGTTRKFK